MSRLQSSTLAQSTFLLQRSPYITVTAVLVSVSRTQTSGWVLIMVEGYMNMKPPKFDLIIEDCDKAIALNKDYVKAINRRANALEALDRLEEALRGWFVTSVTGPCLILVWKFHRLHNCNDFGWVPK